MIAEVMEEMDVPGKYVINISGRHSRKSCLESLVSSLPSFLLTARIIPGNPQPMLTEDKGPSIEGKSI